MLSCRREHERELYIQKALNKREVSSKPMQLGEHNVVLHFTVQQDGLASEYRKQ